MLRWYTPGYMADALEARLNTRAPKRVKDDLSALAMRRHIDESELTRSLIDEAIRRETYPGVAFRTTSTGRDAAVEGRRLYIWQVMETLWASDGDITAAAEYLDLRPDQVRTAMAYYTAYPDEIDRVIKQNQEEAARLESLQALQEKTRRR